MRRRILSIIIVFVLCLNMIPFGTMAAEQDDTKVCIHHPEHTAECGYVEEIQGMPCIHEHKEECYRSITQCVHEHTDECIPEASEKQQDSIPDTTTEDIDVESGTKQSSVPNENTAEKDYSACTHVCSEESGCVTEILDCHHEHDEDCGYVEAVSGHPCEFVCPVCSAEEPGDALPEEGSEEPEEGAAEQTDVPYCLFLVHSLDVEGEQYGSTDFVELDRSNLENDVCDLHDYVLQKDGMEAVRASYLDEETGDLTENWTVSLADFTQGGDPEDGSDYYAVQVLIEYQAAEGYEAVIPENPEPADDPYGIMPLVSFEGGNIKDITFVPANVITIRIEYMYSATGGLAGTQAADSRVYEIAVPGIKRNEAGEITEAGGIERTWDLPSDTASYPGLEGFRIVLDPKPLNAYLVDTELANRATEGSASADEIQNALLNELFAVNTDNPLKPVYQWQIDRPDTPPTSSADYSLNSTYDNQYSDQYNQAWEDARAVRDDFYTAVAESNPPAVHQGANQLASPELTVSLTGEQCLKLLNTDKKEITVTVYYRRNAGFYQVAHWVPNSNLTADEIRSYTDKYPEFNQVGNSDFDNDYIMVYLEHRQGRIGAMTNAGPNPDVTEAAILKTFVAEGFSQKVIEKDTRVDIHYTTAEQYTLIFNTDAAYIARQQLEKENGVVFSLGSDAQGAATSSMKIRRGNTTVEVPDSEYQIPKRTGYAFKGWKYEVKSSGTDVVTETTNGVSRYYKIIPMGSEWTIDDDVIQNAVIDQADDADDRMKAIYLHPIWEAAKTNVRVIFWTEDLSGGNRDVKVEVDASDAGAADYIDYIKPGNYINGDLNQVGENFSNAGSFTFNADIGKILNLSVADGKFGTATQDQFVVEDTGLTGGTMEDNLAAIIDAMFKVRMPRVDTSMGEISSAPFYHPYKVEMADKKDITVDADGSTVINLYYARNVYTLDFTYYGELVNNQGGMQNKPSTGTGIAVATNTVGYSYGNNQDQYDYQYQAGIADGSNAINRWEIVKDQKDAKWTVPEKITISAKYGADLRDVWPATKGEMIEVAADPATENHEVPLGTVIYSTDRTIATFVSWGTTAGPYNKKFLSDRERGENGESTIMGIYRTMSADVIAEPEKPDTVHHLYGYWWNEGLSFYRFNYCYEVPGLTWDDLIHEEDVKTCNIRNRTMEIRNCNTGIIPMDETSVEKGGVDEVEAERRNTIYLVPVSNSHLKEYFDNYSNVLIKVDENGEAEENGQFYAVRHCKQDSNKIYALGRQVIAPSSNSIENQNPSSEVNMTLVNTIADHNTMAWDDWGRTWHTDPTAEKDFYPHIWLGTTEHPYDLYFYYNRARFTIHYMVPARDSSSGEYAIGDQEVIYGEPLSKYNVKLTPGDKNKYSDDSEFNPQCWTPVSNNASLGTGLSKDGYTRLAPDSAADGKGIWNFEGWTLDRSSRTPMTEEAWNERISGNLRLYALWDPPVYRVKFDFDGGIYNGSETFPIQEVKANQGYTSSGMPIPRPMKSGYVFNGWTWYPAEPSGTDDLAASGSAIAGFTFERPITQNMLARASWTEIGKDVYNYKIWYLTDDEEAVPVEKPANADEKGQWLKQEAWGAGTGNVPAPKLDPNRPGNVDPEKFTHVLGCQYFADQDYPSNMTLSLGAVSIPGYTPVKANASIALQLSQNGTDIGTTENVAYFYYRKSLTKSYKIRFQLFNCTGEDGILHDLTTESVTTDQAYFTPTEENFQALKAAGYQLVQTNADGTVRMGPDGNPLAARSYRELEEFIEAENARFDRVNGGSGDMIVTFKVMPIPYTIRYWVGVLRSSEGTKRINSDQSGKPGTLEGAMQEALNRLLGDEVKESVGLGKNPTAYDVTVFFDGYSFTLNNPVYVQNPENRAEWWRFTGWSPAEEAGTKVRFAGRSAEGEYPSLEIDNSIGDLVFLANWERVEERSDTGLTVTNHVVSSNGVKVPEGAEFEYTIRIAMPDDGTELYAHKIDMEGKETLTAIPSDGVLEFRLKDKETMIFDGITGAYTVTQKVTGDMFDSSRDHYYSLIGLTNEEQATDLANGTTSAVLDRANPYDDVVYTNTYTARAHLDTDPAQEGSQGFPVTKYLLDGETKERRNFLGGNEYSFSVTADSQNPDAPVPNVSGNTPEGTGMISLRSVKDAPDLSGSFDSVLFTEPGTCYYVIREEKPESGGVPDVGYDRTMYRVTVSVTVDGTDLKAVPTALEARDSSDDEWQTISNGADDLKTRLVFENVYGLSKGSGSGSSGSRHGSDSGSGGESGDTAAGMLPQTGMLWWPVWVLAAIGAGMLGIGFAREKAARGYYEK